MLTQQDIYAAIEQEGFSGKTLEMLDNYINDIQYGRTNLARFNTAEHGGLCTAGSVLIGAYAVCDYARRRLEASADASASAGKPANWEIDAAQEKLVQQWAEAKQLWFPRSDQHLNLSYGPRIAKGAEAIVYYKAGDHSVIKERTSIYATLGRALEAIVLHNTLFPETQMKVIGFTRDADELFRVILIQPYVGCERLATKEEIDEMVAAKDFKDNWSGEGVNYVGERLYLEDMHPANVFIDVQTGKPTCIDCIVKFIARE